MRSALIIALAGSAAAGKLLDQIACFVSPLTTSASSFSDFLDAMFGGDKQHEHPQPSDFPNFPPIGTGSGIPLPYPTASGVPFPSGTSGVQPFPYSGSESQEKRKIKALHVDYQLAPTTVPSAKPTVMRRELKYRQLSDSALPSFSLFDPNNPPTPTDPATELPTELPSELPGLPTDTAVPELPTDIPTDLPGPPTDLPTPPAGGPTAPFPVPTGEVPFPTSAPFPTAPAGTGAPNLPSTFDTVTRGPKPTAAPEKPAQDDGEEPQNGNWWLEFISQLLGGSKGAEE